jgi:hypothetical protein
LGFAAVDAREIRRGIGDLSRTPRSVALYTPEVKML